MFWETLPGIIASWAAAFAGLGWILNRLWRAWKYGRRIAVAAGKLLEIGDADSWPNGSTSLPSSLSEIYRRQSETHQLVKATKSRLDDYIVAHRLDHQL